MALYPDKLFVEGKAKTVGIYLEDEHGIQFRSKKGVQLNAVEGIYISGKKGTFCTPTDIICRTSQSNIEINSRKAKCYNGVLHGLHSGRRFDYCGCKWTDVASTLAVWIGINGRTNKNIDCVFL